MFFLGESYLNIKLHIVLCFIFFILSAFYSLGSAFAKAPVSVSIYEYDVITKEYASIKDKNIKRIKGRIENVFSGESYVIKEFSQIEKDSDINIIFINVPFSYSEKNKINVSPYFDFEGKYSNYSDSTIYDSPWAKGILYSNKNRVVAGTLFVYHSPFYILKQLSFKSTGEIYPDSYNSRNLLSSLSISPFEIAKTYLVYKNAFYSIKTDPRRVKWSNPGEKLLKKYFTENKGADLYRGVLSSIRSSIKNRKRIEGINSVNNSEQSVGGSYITSTLMSKSQEKGIYINIDENIYKSIKDLDYQPESWSDALFLAWIMSKSPTDGVYIDINRTISDCYDKFSIALDDIYHNSISEMVKYRGMSEKYILDGVKESISSNEKHNCFIR